MEKDFFRDKTVLVMGLGSFGGGLDAVRFLHGAGAGLIVTDTATREKLSPTIDELARDGIQPEYRLGGHIESDFTGPDTDIVLVNPAVRPDNPWLQAARGAGKLITSQMQIFFQLFPGTIVGITGSNGKSTTTALTAHLLSAGLGKQGFGHDRVHLGGNIGHRPLLCSLSELTEKSVAVLELSSFQLEQLACDKLAPHISLITNLTPNHLDAHGTMDAYAAAKENIFIHQPDRPDRPRVSIFNAQDPLTRAWYKKYRREPNRSCRLFSPEDVPASLRERFPLPGRMNLANLAAALRIAEQFTIPADAIADAAASFKGLPDRLEFVAEINGARWYNDTISTTPDSTIAAIEGIAEPKIVIAGGYDKKLPFDAMGRALAEHCKAVVLIGVTARKIAEAVNAAPAVRCEIIFAQDMPDAVRICREKASPGDVVLLSPACASYDMFNNYRHRGRVFKDCVLALQ